MADLNGLLERLNPQRFVRLEFEVDDAYKKFPLDEPTVDTFPEFQKLLGRYYGHLTRAVYHCDVVPEKEDAEALAMDLVERAFEGGRVEAFNRSKSGYNGALPIVLQKVGDAFKKLMLSQWLYEALRRSLDMEDWSEREALAAAYLERFRHVLPQDMASTSPMILATRLEDVFRAHLQAQPLLAKLFSQK